MAEHPTDREWILDPDKWAKWPLLPMKRRADGGPKCGVIVGDPDADGKVYFVEGANIWRYDAEYARTHGRIIHVDTLLATGWEVD